ncbi:MAG: hypothetical protein QMD04_05005 [Anaerolineales bacterium]|nr:hypothetical protein [Anaerolineales bacterium]
MTPDTTNFMLAGYAVIFSVMAIYIASLILRWRNLKRDLIILQEMQAKK